MCVCCARLWLSNDQADKSNQESKTANNNKQFAAIRYRFVVLNKYYKFDRINLRNWKERNLLKQIIIRYVVGTDDETQI